ncbi:MAG: hypothetical protein V4586_04045 [Pseudomonadota bacterium]
MEVPQSSDAAVKLFCKRNGFHKPKRVAVSPVGGFEASNCFPNVKKMVAEHGGSESNGWIIWRAPKLFLEAEHHCVWEAPSGQLLDVTPKFRGEAEILFAPQPELGFDYENLKFQLSRYLNLSGSPFVDAMTAISLQRQEMMTKNAFIEADQMKTFFDQQEADRLLSNMRELLVLAQREAGII